MHNFCLLNIKRPVLSAVFSLLLLVFGLYTFFELSTRELPKNLQPPEVVISTKYTGASPSIIASEISEPIELAVGGAEGIKSIDTLSEIGRSTIKIEFFTNIDIDDAANDIRERIVKKYKRRFRRNNYWCISFKKNGSKQTINDTSYQCE